MRLFANTFSAFATLLLVASGAQALVSTNSVNLYSIWKPPQVAPREKCITLWEGTPVKSFQCLPDTEVDLRYGCLLNSLDSSTAHFDSRLIFVTENRK